MNESRRAARLMLAALAAAGACLMARPTETAAQPTRIGLELGATPAGMALERLNGSGGELDLSATIGTRPALLEFWATWCENCEALHPRLLEAHAEFGDRMDFYAIAVGVNQSPKRIRRHLEKMPVPFPLLWDERGAAVREFQAPNTSYIVVLDAGGRVTYTGTGAAQDIEAAVRTGL